MGFHRRVETQAIVVVVVTHDDLGLQSRGLDLFEEAARLRGDPAVARLNVLGETITRRVATLMKAIRTPA